MDEQGLIQFVEKEIDGEEARRRHEGWADAKVVGLRDGFFFPGFIGK